MLDILSRDALRRPPVALRDAWLRALANLDMATSVENGLCMMDSAPNVGLLPSPGATEDKKECCQPGETGERSMLPVPSYTIPLLGHPT